MALPVDASTGRTRVQVCVGISGLTGVRLTGFARLLFAVAVVRHRASVGGRALLRRADVSSIGSAIRLCEILGGLVLQPFESGLGDPDGSADADARDGVAGDEFVERRGRRAELLGGLGDGQQAAWGSGGRWRHPGFLVSWSPGRGAPGAGPVLCADPVRSLVHASLTPGSRPRPVVSLDAPGSAHASPGPTSWAPTSSRP
jgi:hypothetical protein